MLGLFNFFWLLTCEKYFDQKKSERQLHSKCKFCHFIYTVYQKRKKKEKKKKKKHWDSAVIKVDLFPLSQKDWLSSHLYEEFYLY